MVLTIQLALPGVARAGCGVGGDAWGAAFGMPGAVLDEAVACCPLCAVACCCVVEVPEPADGVPPIAPSEGATRLPAELGRAASPFQYAFDGPWEGCVSSLTGGAVLRSGADVRWGELGAAGRCAVSCVWLT